MSTAVATAPPRIEQAPLQLDMLPADGPAHTAQAPDLASLQLACTGPVKLAEVRISNNGAPHLTVVVLQPRGGIPFVATLHGDVGNEPWFEHLASQLLRPGAIALLRGEGLCFKPHAGEPALQLLHCNHIGLIEIGEKHS